ncbi:MAG: sulfotransferase family 2 domain-containing protein [Sphingomicrobium sp.]
MIISHRHKFIFVAVPKTGTHSVRQALREQMGDEDLEQVGLFVNKRFPMPELAAIRHGHLTLAQVEPFLPADDYKAYFKFGFVRNPFDRFVSYCAFMTRDGDEFGTDPKAVMRHFLFTAPPTGHILFQPQHLFFVGANGAPASDFVGRIEAMQSDYDKICARIGIPSRPLDKVNSSKRGDYRDYYDQQLIDGVAALYGRDLELFDYQF